VLNALVAEVGLQGAGIDAIVGELEPAGVPQHVRVSLASRPTASAARSSILAKPAVRGIASAEDDIDAAFTLKVDRLLKSPAFS